MDHALDEFIAGCRASIERHEEAADRVTAIAP